MAENDLFQEEQDDFFAVDDPEVTPGAGDTLAGGVTPEQLAQYKQHDEWATRFAKDETFARQVIAARAAALGLQVGPQAAQEPARPSAPPADYIETIKATLAPEMQFLAPQIAIATWTATQAAIEPLRQQQTTLQTQRQQETYESMARGLAEESPGWERYENEMLEYMAFMRGALNNTGPMTHPKYGSALKQLYRGVTNDATAAATAGRRMQEAARNRTTTSQAGGRGEGPDVGTMIQNAKTSQQKWQIAMRQALRENGVSS